MKDCAIVHLYDIYRCLTVRKIRHDMCFLIEVYQKMGLRVS